MRPVRVSPRRKRVFSLLRGERDEEDRASRRGARFRDVHGWTSQQIQVLGESFAVPSSDWTAVGTSSHRRPHGELGSDSLPSYVDTEQNPD